MSETPVIEMNLSVIRARRALQSNDLTSLQDMMDDYQKYRNLALHYEGEFSSTSKLYYKTIFEHKDKVAKEILRCIDGLMDAKMQAESAAHFENDDFQDAVKSLLKK